jgi:hypothetical protein
MWASSVVEVVAHTAELAAAGDLGSYLDLSIKDNRGKE